MRRDCSPAVRQAGELPQPSLEVGRQGKKTHVCRKDGQVATSTSTPGDRGGEGWPRAAGTGTARRGSPGDERPLPSEARRGGGGGVSEPRSRPRAAGERCGQRAGGRCEVH